jgi:hypothetical protein
LDLQTSIPVNYSEYVMSVPEHFTYSSNLKGFIVPKIKVKKEKNSIVLSSESE